MGLTLARLVPGIDLCLQLVALGQQGTVLRRQVLDDRSGTGPELVGSDAGTGNGFVVHEVVQGFGDLQATDLNAFSHHLPHYLSFTQSPLRAPLKTTCGSTPALSERLVGDGLAVL